MTITRNDVVASSQLCMQVVSRDSKALAGVQAETRYGSVGTADGSRQSIRVRSCWYKSRSLIHFLSVQSFLLIVCERFLPSCLHTLLLLHTLGSGSSESRLTRLTPVHRLLAATPQRLKLAAGPCVCVVTLNTSRRRQSNLTLCLKS